MTRASSIFSAFLAMCMVGVLDAFFEYDKASRRDEVRSNLAPDADWLKQYPPTSILIEGHSEERATSEYNLALGDRRARNLRPLQFEPRAPRRESQCPRATR